MIHPQLLAASGCYVFQHAWATPSPTLLDFQALGAPRLSAAFNRVAAACCRSTSFSWRWNRLNPNTPRTRMSHLFVPYTACSNPCNLISSCLVQPSTCLIYTQFTSPCHWVGLGVLIGLLHEHSLHIKASKIGPYATATMNLTYDSVLHWLVVLSHLKYEGK